MRTKTTCFALSCVFGLLLALPALTRGGQKVINKTYFTLDTTAGVSSDGQGAYVHGQGGVGALITSAGDFTATFYDRSKRSLKVNYGNPSDPLNAPFNGIHVVDTAATQSWDAITVRDIMTIPVGGPPATRNGNILVQKDYIDSDGIHHVATQNWNTYDVPGLQFSVTRTALGQWIVQSQNDDQTNLKFFHPTGSGWVFESSAAYHIPIRMTINQ